MARAAELQDQPNDRVEIRGDDLRAFKAKHKIEDKLTERNVLSFPPHALLPRL